MGCYSPHYSLLSCLDPFSPVCPLSDTPRPLNLEFLLYGNKWKLAPGTCLARASPALHLRATTEVAVKAQ